MSLNTMGNRSATEVFQPAAAAVAANPLAPDTDVSNANSYLSNLATYIPSETILLFSLTGAVVSEAKGPLPALGIFDASKIEDWVMIFTILSPLLVYVLTVIKKRQLLMQAGGAAANSPWVPGIKTLWSMAAATLAFFVWGTMMGYGVQNLDALQVVQLAATSTGLALIGKLIAP